MVDFLVAITREAGERLLGASRHIRGKKSGSGNWVTEADLVSERHIIQSIHKKFSDHAILAEETQKTLRHPEREPHLWVIDPLDGTTNFSYHVPFFAVSVAYVQRGILQCGAIYDPSRREVFWAKKGKGAYLHDKQVHVGQETSFSGALVDVGFPYRKENFDRTYPIGAVFHKLGARAINFGSAALECVYVASGRLSLYYEVGLKPWDVAAGALLIEEAGGKVVSEGNVFNPFHFERFLVGNAALVEKAQQLMSTAVLPSLSGAWKQSKAEELAAHGAWMRGPREKRYWKRPVFS